MKFSPVPYRLSIALAAASISFSASAQVQSPSASVATPDELRAAAQPTHDQTWWKHAYTYEIYPAAFRIQTATVSATRTA